MRFQQFLLVITGAVLLATTPYVGVANAQISTSASHAITVMNTIHASLNRVLREKSRAVLESEYSGILNNISISEIEDKEIIDLISLIMDTYTKFRLDERERQRLRVNLDKELENTLHQAVLEERDRYSVEGSLSSVSHLIQIGTAKLMLFKIAGTGTGVGAAAGAASAAGAAGISGTALTAAPLVLTGTAIYLAADAGLSYLRVQRATKRYQEALEATDWRLETDAIEEINRVHKAFLRTYWQILRRHEVSEDWRITQDQFNRMHDSIQISEVGARYRTITALESDLARFPAYWRFRAMSAYAAGNRDDALRSAQRYISINNHVLRRDPHLASAMQIKMLLTDYRNGQEDILSDLQVLLANSDKPEFRLFAAYRYAEAGRFDLAVRQLLGNIDARQLVSISSKSLADLADIDGLNAQDQALIENAALMALDNGSLSMWDRIYIASRLHTEGIRTELRDRAGDISAANEAEFYQDAVGVLYENISPMEDLVFHVPLTWLNDVESGLVARITFGKLDRRVEAEILDSEATLTLQDVVLQDRNTGSLPDPIPVVLEFGTEGSVSRIAGTIIASRVPIEAGFVEAAQETIGATLSGWLGYSENPVERPDERLQYRLEIDNIEVLEECYDYWTFERGLCSSDG